MFSSVLQKSNNDISDAGIKPAPFFQPVVQRQVAGDRQLSSPRFAGDALLQNVFNGRDLVSQTKNSRATASVKAIQEALIAAGFPLPQFGADGIFGTETANAARSFQQASGLELAQQDGIVGPVTLSRLDSRFPTTNAAGSPDVCTTPKKVPIDVFIMDGASRNTALDFTTMNQVYGPCCLQFVQNSFTSFNAAETATILGTDSLLEVTDCDSGMSADETQLLAAVTGRGPTGRAKLVFVNTLSPTSRGHSYSPLCASGTKPGLANTALVEVAAGARTPSHELGHVLLNVIRDHAVVESNIMHVTPGSTGSDAAKVQCDIIFART